jgi:hypothetical protein
MLQNSWVQNWVQFIRWSSAAIDLTYLFFIAPPILSFGTALRRTVRALDAGRVHEDHLRTAVSAARAGSKRPHHGRRPHLQCAGGAG